MLTPCKAILGDYAITTVPRVVRQAEGALLVPFGSSVKPGLYGSDGALIRAGAYFRGPPTNGFPISESEIILPADPVQAAPKEFTYVYVGHLEGHYGHFFFTILSRLWSLPRLLSSRIKLVVLNSIHIGDFFHIDFSRTMFDALGITIDNFIVITEPTIFDSIEIPEPAAEENHSGSPEFADLCHRIGHHVLAGTDVKQTDRPVFLTKRHLARGVTHLIGEDVFCNELENSGFEIIAPERLTFREQIELWVTRRMVGGVAGSAFHTSIFVPSRRYVALAWHYEIFSCQHIIDLLNKNDAAHYYPTAGLENVGEGTGHFHHGLKLPDPVELARAYAAIVMG